MTTSYEYAKYVAPWAPPPLSKTVDRQIVIDTICRRLMSPDFNMSVRRFIMGCTVHDGMSKSEKKRITRKWQRKLRRINFRRKALRELCQFMIHMKAVNFLGPRPESTQEEARILLKDFKSIDHSHMKWFPVEIVLMLWPRAAAHMVCSSLGYACATKAARIVWDGHLREENWCEWIYSCYRCDASKALRAAVQGPSYSLRRQRHKGYMADYRQGKVVICKELLGREPPHGGFAAWF